jgi:hypothetical protein
MYIFIESSMSKTPLRINSSALAALIGRHPYTSRGDAILATWKSTDRDTYRDAHDAAGIETPEARRRRVQMAYPEITAVSRTTKPSLLQSTLRGISTSMFLDDDTGRSGTESKHDITRQEAESVARETAYTQHGIDREHIVLDRVNTVLDASFVMDDRLWTRDVGCVPSGRRVVIQGRVDALETGKDPRLLEIKTRARGLFMNLREYERVQIETYLLLTGTHSAILAEAYFPSRAATDPDLNMIRIARDEDRIQGIIDDAIRASAALDRVVSCPHAQRAFLTTRHRDALVDRWIDEINASTPTE